MTTTVITVTRLAPFWPRDAWMADRVSADLPRLRLALPPRPGRGLSAYFPSVDGAGYFSPEG